METIITGEPDLECHTCVLIAQRDRGEAPLWDAIVRTPHWDVVHSYNTALPGWLVLVARRHRAAIADLDGAEAHELGALLRDVSVAVQQVTGCAKTYVVQFAEALEHPHVHFHVIPRAADLPAEFRGPGVFRLLGVEDAQRVSDSQMNAIATAVRAALPAWA